jgi:hypothetical protein
MKTTIKTAINLLTRETKTQREDFYSRSVSYQMNRLTAMINKFETMDEDSTSRHMKYGIEANYKHAVKVNENININTLSWLKDSEEYFNSKIEVAAAKLQSFGFVEDHISMSIVEAELDNNRGLSFYVTGFDHNTNEYIGRVKARLTWVDCYDKQSHYRWIVTLKKSK